MAALAGCVQTRTPPASPGFAPATPLAALAGTYVNLRDAGTDAYLARVSWLLLPPDPRVPHDSIDRVRLEVHGDTVFVSARRGASEVVRDTLLLGRDLEPAGAAYLLRTRRPPPDAPDSPLLGVTRARRLIGLDPQGRLRIEERETATGLVYLLVPVHFKSRAVHWFARRPDGG